MTPAWLEHAAAFIVLWFALAIILGVILATVIRAGAREMPPAPDTDPPEYEPGDDEAQRIAEQFAEAAAEEDRTHD